MPKSAIDPFFATNNEPITAGRHGAVVTPSDSADLPHVTSALIVTIGTSGTGVAVIFADDPDSAPVTIPLAVGTTQIYGQIRRVMATGTTLGTGGGGVVAIWSQ